MTTRYRSFLRVSLLVTAFLLLFDGGFVMPETKELSMNTMLYLAGVQSSVLATVPENEFNTLSAELRKRQEELDLREASLADREVKARDFGGTGDTSTYILATILFILTVLIVLNFAMDWVRASRAHYEESLG